MKTINKPMPNKREPKSTTFAANFRNIKPGSPKCIVLETAAEFRQFAGTYGILKKEGIQLRTQSDGDAVLVWRIK